MKKKRRFHNVELFLVISILMLALIIRLGITDLHNLIPINSDGAAYYYAALNINKYGVLTHDRLGEMYKGSVDLYVATDIAPGYPLFLAMLFSVFGSSDPFIGYIAQIVLSILTLLFIWGLLKETDIHAYVRIPVLFLAAVYPGFCYNLDYLLTEHLFTFLICVFLYLFYVAIRKDSLMLFMLSNIALTYAIMTRAQGFYYFFLELIFIISRKRPIREKVKRSSVSSMVLLCALIPLWLYFFLSTNKFILYPSGGEGPRTWGAQPYYIDMGFTNGKNLEMVRNMNKSANPVVYYRWRLWGSISYMWREIWDEHLALPGQILKHFRWIHYFVIIPTLCSLGFVFNKGRWKLNLIGAAIIITIVAQMFVHGLPRYVYSTVPLLFIVFGVFVNGFVKFWMSPRIEREKIIVHLKLLPLLWFGIILYSTYIFPAQIDTEQSALRLSRYLSTNIQQVEKSRIIHSIYLMPDEAAISISGMGERKGHTYVGKPDEPMIFNIQMPEVPAYEPGNIVTKITCHFSYDCFNQITMYWQGRNTKEYSENKVYVSPTDPLNNTYTFYIDDLVEKILLVPARYRESAFVFDKIEIQWFSL